MWPNAKEMMLRTPDGTKNETRFEPPVTVIAVYKKKKTENVQDSFITSNLRVHT